MKVLKYATLSALLVWFVHQAFKAGSEEALSKLDVWQDPPTWVNGEWMDADVWDDEATLFPERPDAFWPTERGSW